MKKALKAVVTAAMKDNNWEKFTKPTVKEGKTTWPQAANDQEKYGVRFDRDTAKEAANSTDHKFFMQPNSGKGIPSSIKRWRDRHGTHANMAEVIVKKDGTKEDVKAALEQAIETV
ncbi:hypothetical protein B0T24DRAFT_596692 [Lasiosphaeria ovina]|uniref:Uncharacterized protein n=1 Tax=Lasiosphaeria ovina TaxID=92902 RepID=A0AAE0N129_9PEZI|nr:hypothetical protein B0T24DRAFT_596692 [Lasiosphaeria ovina]